MSTIFTPAGADRATGGYLRAEATAAAPASQAGRRIASLDLIRGAVMLLMAIDHVRVFSGIPPGGPTPGVFFTRWVTHFCAPAFVFLAGTAAFLHGQKLAETRALSRYLALRGAWLVLLELTVLRFGWTFNFDYGSYLLAGVIWMLGWCMILMAGLVHLPLRATAALGLVMILGHNLLDPFVAGLNDAADASRIGWLGRFLYLGGPVRIGGDGGTTMAVLYSLVPWVGVMAAGYGFGAVMRLPAEQRRRWCVGIGSAAIAAFLVLRGLNVYGDPRPWGEGPAPALLQFLSTTKYPASLLFLLMTLGPTILLIPFVETSRGRVARWLTVFGRVPFFYYVLHIPLIHLMFVGLSLVRFGEVVPWLTANHPMFMPAPPDGYTYGLPALYAVTVAAIVALYFPCRWFAALKERRKDAWLSYL